MNSSKIRQLLASTKVCVARAISNAVEPLPFSEAKPFSEIPGPKAYPLIKSLPYALKDVPVPLSQLGPLLDHLREQFGPIVRWELPLFRPSIFVFDPDMLNHILKHGVGKFPTRDAGSYIISFRKKRKEWHDGTVGLLPSNGQEWYDMRSKVQQPLMRPKTCEQYVSSMDQVAQDFIEHVKDLRDPITKEVPEHFQAEMYKWSLESIGVVALNTRLGCLKKDVDDTADGPKMIQSVNNLFATMGELEFSLKTWKLFPTKMFRRFESEMEKVTLIGMKHVKNQMEKLKKKTNEEELSVLEKFLTTPGMSKGIASTMALDMLLAGIDTTGNAMAYFLFHIAKNPESQELLHKEIDRVLPDVKAPVTTQALNDMPYMKACIKESMRIHPVASGFGRNIVNDVTVEGYQVPKGTFMIAAIHSMSLENQHYPDAMKFKPERWIRGCPEQSSANPYTFLPFGHGARMCVGRRIAEQELWVLAAKMLKQFRVEYHYDDIGMVTRLVNAPKLPLRFQFHDRQ